MINNEYPPLGGGTASINHLLLTELSREPQFKVDLVTSSGSREYKEEILSPTVTIYRIPIPRSDIHHAANGELLSFALRSFLFCRKLIKKFSYDKVFAWSTVPSGAVAFALYFFYRIPYVVRVSGPDIPGFERRYNFIYPFLRPLLNLCWKHSLATVVKCEEEASLLRESLPNATTILIPNGVELSSQRLANFSNISPLQLVSVGRLIERKRHDIAIRAVHLLKSKGLRVQLSIIGDGDSRKSLESLIRELDLSDNVKLLGYVPRGQVQDLLLRHHLFVHCSEAEGMSVATLEAIAVGLPVILTKCGGMDSFLKEGENGYFLGELEPGALAELICKLIDNRASLEAMGSRSYHLAEAHSSTQMAERYAQLLLKAQ